MIEYLKIAWRNIWRKRFRTLLTAGVAFLAVFLSILMDGFQKGQWESMIDGILHSYSGYVQVHSKGYWDEMTFDYSMDYNDTLIKEISSAKYVKNVLPRLESFALGSAGVKTKGVIVTGIDPQKEDEMTKLKSKIVKGTYLSQSDTAVMISQRLADFLKLQPNDTLIIIGQGYQGISAAGKYPVKGIVKLPSPEFDNKMVYLPLNIAQELFSSTNRITSMVIDIEHPRFMKDAAKDIKNKVNLSTFEVMDWTEMMKELYEQFIIDGLSNQIILGILYLIVGFIAFGTVMMMTNERSREFAIMIATGMKKRLVILMVSLELFYIMIIGLVSGIICSVPILFYIHSYPIHITGETAKVYVSYGMEPILDISWPPYYILNQAIIVFILILISMIFPLYKIYRMNVSKSIRN